jgi:c-di-GMP-binding flagellar brake protein YcgR
MVLRLGSKVRVRVGKSWYGTIVEGVADDLSFFISPLLSLQAKIALAKGRIYTVNTVSERGIFEFEALVLDTNYTALNENFPLNKLQIITEPRLIQRRAAYRVMIMADLRIREPGEDGTFSKEDLGYQAKALNLSENGMLFLATKIYSPGTVLHCDIMLNKFGMDFTLRGIVAEVVRAGSMVTDGTLYRTGVHFKEMRRQDRGLLVKFIMLSQREMRKWQSRSGD